MSCQRKILFDPCPAPAAQTATQHPGNLGAIVNQHIDRAAKAISLPKRLPLSSDSRKRNHRSLPVRMDNGKYQMFTGYRVQHNNILGPYKGGIRYHQDVCLEEVRGLASAMTGRAHCMTFRLAAAKAACSLTRRCTASAKSSASPVASHTRWRARLGPEYDIPAPDVGPNSQVMNWLMDTYMNIAGALDKNAMRRVVTGKSITSGGSLGREAATGQGCVHCITEWAKRSPLRPDRQDRRDSGLWQRRFVHRQNLVEARWSLVATGDIPWHRQS